MSLADSQTADGVTWKVEGDQRFGGMLPQIRIGSALYDAKQHLTRAATLVESLFTPLRPTQG